MMERRAAIDIGTNSVKLLVAEVEAGAIRETIHDEQRTTRLGEGMSRTGRLSATAVERTAYEVARLAELARSLGARDIRAGGTAALRNTRDTNAHDLVEAVKSGSGLDVRVLSAERELELARGVTLAAFGGFNPLVVVDIGGGSTEVTVAVEGEIWEAWSYDLGASSLTEDLGGAPAADLHSWDEMLVECSSVLWDAIRESDTTVLVIQGGTAYCAARLAVGESGDPHGEGISLAWLAELVQIVGEMTPEEIEELLSFDPARSPVFYAGLVLILYFCGVCGMQDFVFSGFSLRHGMVLAEEW